MPQLISKKSNFLTTFFLVAIVLFKLYNDELFPFSGYIPLDLAEKRNLATINFLRLGSTNWTHEYYYPRLFLLPFFVLYWLFSLSIGKVAFLMFFTMIFLLIISGYFIFHKLGGHSVGLILVPLLVVNGNFANVVGIFFLLFLIENPTIFRMLILSFGYPPLVVFTLPYLFLLKKKILVFLGSFLIALHLLIIRPNENFGLFWTGFNSWIRGFNPYVFIAIEMSFLTYFIWVITKKDEKLSSDSILPLTNLLIVLFLFLGGFNFYWIVKSLILFPMFVTIFAKERHSA